MQIIPHLTELLSETSILLIQSSLLLWIAREITLKDSSFHMLCVTPGNLYSLVQLVSRCERILKVSRFVPLSEQWVKFNIVVRMQSHTCKRGVNG